MINRCMDKREDDVDEEYAECLYPNCYIEECPHWKAMEKLRLIEKVISEHDQLPPV